LRGFDSLIDVARFLESANPGAGHSMWPKENPMVLAAYRAIVCALMGDTGRGVELLDDAVENLHNQDARKHLQDVRQRVAALTTSQ
jgi:hypothetical protein